MRHRLSKILHYLGSKLQSCFEFIKFVFVPRQKYFIIGTLVVVVFSLAFWGRSAYAGIIPDWEDVMWLLNSVMFMFCSMLGNIAMKVFALVIMVCQYNTFVTSPAVEKAWVLIRDVCNMGFVVILLVIAFAQILNVQKYSIKTLLPKVLITAVLINFSKLLCGLMIDISQVAMMTFVNGFQATAGANLVNGLGLKELMDMSSQNAENGSAKANGPTGAQIFLALCIGILILVAMICVMFFIALILLLRIVTLWLLVILAPAAWAFGMFPGMGETKYNEWWKKFGSTVAVGPFMAFFLWISLLVMSNPTAMIANMNEMSAGIEAKGGDKPAVGYLDNLAQAAMGLALLMASLIAAQEGGGAMGKLASKGQAVATAAVQKTAMKFSGAQAVADRGKAAYSGYKEQKEAKHAEKMGAWKEKGAGVYSAQQKIQTNLTHPVSAIKAASAGIKKGAEAYSTSRTAGGGVMKSLSAAKKAAVKEGKASFMKDQGGKIGMRMANSIDSAANKKEMEKGKTALESRGIKSDKDLDDVISGKLEASDAEKKNALLMKAERGNLTEDQAKQGKEMMSDDAASTAAFEASMKKKQINLAYDFDNAESAAQFATDVKNGDVDLTKQNESAYKDPKFMGAAYQALGSKAFGAQMGKVAERSDDHKNALSGTLKDPNFMPGVVADLETKRTKTTADAKTKKETYNRLNAAGSGADAKDIKEAKDRFEEADAAQKRAEREATDVHTSLPKTIAKVSGDLDSAFTTRYHNVKPPAGKIDPSYINTDTEEAGISDVEKAKREAAKAKLGTEAKDASGASLGVDKEALGGYVRNLNAKDIAKLKIGPKASATVNETVAANVSANTLNNLARSTEDGAEEQVRALTDQMLALANKTKPVDASGDSVEVKAAKKKEREDIDKALKELQMAITKEDAKAAMGQNRIDQVDAATTAHAPVPPPKTPATQSEINKMNSAKSLISMKIDSATNGATVATTVNINQLNKLANSDEDGATEKLQEIMHEMAKTLQATPKGVAGADELANKLKEAMENNPAIKIAAESDATLKAAIATARAKHSP